MKNIGMWFKNQNENFVGICKLKSNLSIFEDAIIVKMTILADFNIFELNITEKKSIYTS